MESRIQLAEERHRKGYNCAQAVGCTYCDLLGMDEDTMFRMLEGYGFGMGCMNGVCGAVSGVIALAGLQSSEGTGNVTTKKKTYQISASVIDAFLKKNGSIICRELKGVDTGKVLRSCPGCIEDACLIAEELLK